MRSFVSKTTQQTKDTRRSFFEASRPKSPPEVGYWPILDVCLASNISPPPITSSKQNQRPFRCGSAAKRFLDQSSRQSCVIFDKLSFLTTCISQMFHRSLTKVEHTPCRGGSSGMQLHFHTLRSISAENSEIQLIKETGASFAKPVFP